MGQADARTKRRPARRLDPRDRRRICRRTVILFSDFGPGNDSQGSGSARMITAAVASRAGASEIPSELGRYHRAHDIEIQTVSTCQIELRCARTESGNAAVAPPRSVMNLRRFMPAPTLRRPHFNGSTDCLARASRHWSMSPLGQSLQKRDVRTTSAFPPKATELRTSRHVSNVPILLQKSVEGFREQ
jgi:hypothetical protein